MKQELIHGPGVGLKRMVEELRAIAAECLFHLQRFRRLDANNHRIKWYGLLRLRIHPIWAGDKPHEYLSCNVQFQICWL
jgi:hypothetical protein